jgi:peptidoglycan-associated lipoprotein
MNRICLLVLVAALCGCHHGDHIRLPIVVADPIREGGTSESTGSAIETPAASSERTTEGSGSAGTKGSARPEGTVPKNVTVVVQELNGELKDAFFDYDRSGLTADAIAALRQDATLLLPILTEFPQLKVTVEGHCDERGSAEYNLGLGDHRAGGAVEVLQRFGVPLEHMEIVSYGKERPQCTEMLESCWRLNRRAHLVIRPPASTD